MIEEDYVSFETAKLLKEKGFKEWCRKSYGMDVRYKGRTIDFDEECELRDEGYGDDIEYIDGGRLYHSGWDNSDENGKIYAAPTLWGVMKWLREKHNIFISISFRFSRNADNDINFSYYAEKYENHYGYGDGEFISYEQACESAIKYCLENLI